MKRKQHSSEQIIRKLGEAKAISNNGNVCGRCLVPKPGGGVILHGFFWTTGVMTDLRVLSGCVKSLARDVNDQGQVVGYCATQTGSGPAFIWQNRVMSNLNDLIPADSGVFLIEAKSIDDSGRILCSATGQNASFVAVLLTPIPPILGDTNCDKLVDVDDLLTVINDWGKCPRQSRGLKDCVPAISSKTMSSMSMTCWSSSTTGRSSNGCPAMSSRRSTLTTHQRHLHPLAAS